LDPATAAKLERGKRTVEVLKQDLHNPIKVEKQVVIFYALTRGFLDDIAVNDIQRFEAALTSWLDLNHTEILDHIRKTNKLPSDEAFAAAINEFKRTFA
jgi:F-type H+-transporting ATPase subunit alpha